ncbi:MULTISPECIES: phage tail spike protein [Streptococcus]|uniref:Phage tail spike protein n=1 Tax=Streptococcus caledonicus TaxID=2614158 RepID=A0ABW0UAG1_9STRE|nr:phage tail spike protein [Streptococcus sp. S784/96/1]
MLLTIHDANLQKVAFIDNDKQSTLNYYGDTWNRDLPTGSSTFEFTVYKKAIKSDTASQKTYNYLNEKAFVSFQHHGKSYVFSVMTVEENEQTIKCYCENLNLELINEYANPYKATKAMSFVEYCNAMDLLNFTYLSVGINEISDQKRTLEWEGQDTKLARLLSLATKFDAEIDFDTELNADSSIKAFKVNVYHEYDDNHQGVGRVRNDIQLTYGKNLKSIKRKIDKTGIYTMIRPTGKGKTKNAKGEEVETVVTIGGLSAWSENNADGVREFYQSGEALYAPLAAQMYPSTFTSKTQKDQWIRKDIEVESDNPSVIRAAAIRDLKKNAYPALTYEVDGFIDVEIGDTIRIYDDGFNPILLIKARVLEQKISFTNPASNKTTFANFKAIENNLSDGIQAAFERLFEASKPYLIKLSTDNGIIFKNQIGESLITPTLYRGGKPVVAGVTWRWSLDGNVTTGMTYLVRGSSITDTVTLTVAAYIGNDEVAVDEISLVNVVDGKLGTPGTPGRDGRTPYVHTAWANNATGTDGFSLDSSINKLYIGIYTDFEPADSQDPARYKWTKIKGEKGDKGEPGQRGLDGLQGERGEQGLPGKNGVDGRTQYTHIAYSNSADGSKDFSVSASDRAYIGMYVDFNSADSNNPSDYAWTLVKGSNGANGVAGKAGVDGRTPYLHIAYATSNDGSQGFSTTDSVNKTYIGTYTDYTQADSTSYTAYKWTLIKGADGNGIANVTNYYLATTASSGVTKATTGWTTTPQQISVDKRYLWNYRVELYTNGTSKETTPAVIGVRGDQGLQGTSGNSYHLFTTNYRYAQPDINRYVAVGYTGTWLVNEDTSAVKVGDTVQMAVYNTDKVGTVYVLATVTAVASNRSLTTVSKGVIDKGDRGLQGIQGIQGAKGEQGIPGAQGADGRTQYTHIAYADNATGGGFSQTDQTKAYIGMYQDFNAVDSNNPAAYRWTKWKGSDGANGVPGAKGADGKTPYIHFAYANSADGRTDFSLTQTGNKRYIGTYTDYTATDSQDPTKYRWVDMVGTVEVGGRNLWASTKILPYGTVLNPFEVRSSRYYTEIYTDILLESNQTYTISYEPEVKIGNIADLRIGIGRNAGAAARNYVADFIPWTSANLATGTFTFTTGNIGTDKLFSLRPVINSKNNNTEYHVVFKDFKLEKGNIPTGWSPAPEDVDAKIDTKADQLLTQEQLNALNERNQILEAEMKAKASMEALSELEKAYNAFVDKNKKDAAQSEKDLIEAGRRIELLTTQFGGLAELKTFIDTYMKSTNEGLIIGKNDASSTIKVSSDRISMFSAGREVMYISQGVIHIDNGIFTASVQIGKFRTEQYHLNADMNVIRYVG